MNTLFSDALLMKSLILFLLLGSIVGLFAGIVLLLRPDWMKSLSKRANHWVSTRKWARPLGRAIVVENWLYRHNQLSGALLLAAAIYVVYFITTVFDKSGVLISVFKTASISPIVMAGLIDAVVLTCLMVAIFAAIISLFLGLRPSMLRELEQRANKKTSLRQMLKPLEVKREGLDQYVFQNVRLVGVLILIASIYTLVILLDSLTNF